MNRIGIMTFYDADGIVDNSVVYYLKSLKSVVNQLIVIVNGNVHDKEKEKLEEIADRVLIRSNLGFDAGAYKMILCNQHFIKKLKNYDEIVLSNDTCFGPLKPFCNIFAEMEGRDTDFWGINYVENKLAGYLQSYFLVFKSNTYKCLIEYFRINIEEYETDINNIYAKFEVGLFHYMVRQGFRFDYYCRSKIDLYKSPNYGLTEAGLPIIKKKSFDPQNCIWSNCIAALKYISHHFDYDLKMITDTVWRKYKIKLDLEKEFSQDLLEEKYDLWEADIDCSQMIKFCQKNKELYIYGTGIIARKLFVIYQEYMSDFVGFIVSDKKGQDAYLYHYPVFCISDIKKSDVSILVGLNQKNTDMVRKILEPFTNCLFLFEYEDESAEEPLVL